MKTPKEMFRAANGYKTSGYSINMIVDVIENEFSRDAHELKTSGMTETRIRKTLQDRWAKLNRLFKKEWGFEPLPKSYLG